MVDRLDASDVVVHVVYDYDPTPGVAGHLTFAALAGGVRYVRIAIAPRLNANDLLAILGHEFRHAVEIADEPAVVDQTSMALFYAKVGERRRTGERCPTLDTAAAVAAGERIRRRRQEVAGWTFQTAGRSRRQQVRTNLGATRSASRARRSFIGCRRGALR